MEASNYKHHKKNRQNKIWEITRLKSTAGKVLTDQLAPTVYGIEQARDQMKANTTNISMEEEIDRLFNIITSTINEGDSSVRFRKRKRNQIVHGC